MKKILCGFLTIVMMILGAVCVAERTEESPFVLIQEGKTANVYQTADETVWMAALEGGTLCGLISEEVSGGDLWYHVLYLNDQRKAATGYIHAGAAQRLSMTEMEEKMSDLRVLNDVLDLTDALNDYLSEQNGTSPTGSVPTSRKEEDTGRDVLGEMYDTALSLLKKMAGIDLSAEMSDFTEAGQKTVENVQKAGEEIIQAARKATEKLLEAAGEHQKEMAEAMKQGITTAMDTNMSALKEELESIGKKITETAGDEITRAVAVRDEDMAALKEEISNIGKTVAEAVGEEISKAETARDKDLAALKEDVSNIGKTVAEAVGEEISKEKAARDKDLATLKEEISNIGETVAEAVGEEISRAKETIEKDAASLQEGLKEFEGNVSENVSQAGENIEKALKDLTSLLERLKEDEKKGEEVEDPNGDAWSLRGFIERLEELRNSLVKKVDEKLAQGVINAADQALRGLEKMEEYGITVSDLITTVKSNYESSGFFEGTENMINVINNLSSMIGSL